MSLAHVLLGLLSEPASGYDLKRQFDLTLRHFWSAELSQIYPTLKRIEAEGLVTGEQVPSALGPNRKVYRRTAKGEAALERWLSSPPELSRPRHEFLAQLYVLGERNDSARTRELLQDLRALFLRTLSHYRQLEAQWFGASDSLPDDLFHGFLTLRFGVKRMEASVAWCDEALQRLDARAGEMPPPGRGDR